MTPIPVGIGRQSTESLVPETAPASDLSAEIVDSESAPEVELTDAERKASMIEQLRADHADEEAWAAVGELKARGWSFPGLSRELQVAWLSPHSGASPSLAPYAASCLKDGRACAIGTTVKELVENVRLWEQSQMRVKPPFRTNEVVPAYVWPDAN